MRTYPTTDLLPEEIHCRHFFTTGENGVKIHYVREGETIAMNEAINAGANPESLVIVDIEDVPLAYMPGNATRIRVKAAGELAHFKSHELV